MGELHDMTKIWPQNWVTVKNYLWYGNLIIQIANINFIYYTSVLETFFLKRVKKVTGRAIILDLNLKEWGLNNINTIWRKNDQDILICVMIKVENTECD